MRKRASPVTRQWPTDRLEIGDGRQREIGVLARTLWVVERRSGSGRNPQEEAARSASGVTATSSLIAGNDCFQKMAKPVSTADMGALGTGSLGPTADRPVLALKADKAAIRLPPLQPVSRSNRATAAPGWPLCALSGRHRLGKPRTTRLAARARLSHFYTAASCPLRSIARQLHFTEPATFLHRRSAVHIDGRVKCDFAAIPADYRMHRTAYEAHLLADHLDDKAPAREKVIHAPQDLTPEHLLIGPMNEYDLITRSKPQYPPGRSPPASGSAGHPVGAHPDRRIRRIRIRRHRWHAHRR
ncbi:hypothetical protein M2281_003888 [Mesorhizobium soli]|nr:hypothetical protein [Mesorhizobium soli]